MPGGILFGDICGGGCNFFCMKTYEVAALLNHTAVKKDSDVNNILL